MTIEEEDHPMMVPPDQALFEAVAKRDYESLARLYGQSARDAVNTYLSMKSRWSTPHRRASRGRYPKLGKNLETRTPHECGCVESKIRVACPMPYISSTPFPLTEMAVNSLGPIDFH